MQTKITLDMLTAESVSVLTQKFIEVDGMPLQVGSNFRRAYSNTTEDRILLKEDLPDEYFNAVIAVWGNHP